MTTTTYYVALHTGEIMQEEEYTQKASVLVGMLNTVFGTGTLDTISSPFESASVDVEVKHGDDGLTAEAVIDFTHESRVTLDKGKLSVMVKGGPIGQEFPSIKIVKKQVK